MSSQKDEEKKNIMPLLEQLLQEHVLFNPLRLCIMSILLLHKNGVSFAELKRMLNVSPSTLEANIERLEKEGYLMKRKVLRDLHVRVIVAPTEKGVKNTKRTLMILYEFLRQILGQDS